MRTTSTSWLHALLAGLFALAMLSAPAEQARSVLARAAFAAAYAMPDGTLPDICGDHAGPAQHAGLADCLACIVMTAPGLPAPAATALARMAPPAAAELVAPDLPAAPAAACQPRQARAPPPVRVA